MTAALPAGVDPPFPPDFQPVRPARPFFLTHIIGDNARTFKIFQRFIGVFSRVISVHFLAFHQWRCQRRVGRAWSIPSPSSRQPDKRAGRAGSSARFSRLRRHGWSARLSGGRRRPREGPGPEGFPPSRSLKFPAGGMVLTSSPWWRGQVGRALNRTDEPGDHAGRTPARVDDCGPGPVASGCRSVGRDRAVGSRAAGMPAVVAGQAGCRSPEWSFFGNAGVFRQARRRVLRASRRLRRGQG